MCIIYSGKTVDVIYVMIEEKSQVNVKGGRRL